MKIARLSLPQGVRFAAVDAVGNYAVLAADPIRSGIELDNIALTGEVIERGKAQLLAPVDSFGKVIGLGGTYHTDDTTVDPTQLPVIFFKPSTAIAAPQEELHYPRWSGEVLHEPELAIVIGKECKNVAPSAAAEVIFGFTAANDLTDLGSKAVDLQWARSKGFDGACPLGPVINTDLDVQDVEISIAVNGEVLGAASTKRLAYSINDLVSLISQMFTLLPGDVILTGSPMPAVPALLGDEVTVNVAGIGQLQNRVAELTQRL